MSLDLAYFKLHHSYRDVGGTNQIMSLYILVSRHIFDENISIKNSYAKNTYKCNINNHGKSTPISISNEIQNHSLMFLQK